MMRSDQREREEVVRGESGKGMSSELWRLRREAGVSYSTTSPGGWSGRCLYMRVNWTSRHTRMHARVVVFGKATKLVDGAWGGV